MLAEVPEIQFVHCSERRVAGWCFGRMRGKFPEGQRRRPKPKPPGVAAGPGLGPASSPRRSNTRAVAGRGGKRGGAALEVPGSGRGGGGGQPLPGLAGVSRVPPSSRSRAGRRRRSPDASEERKVFPSRAAREAGSGREEAEEEREAAARGRGRLFVSSSPAPGRPTGRRTDGRTDGAASTFVPSRGEARRRRLPEQRSRKPEERRERPDRIGRAGRGPGRGGGRGEAARIRRECPSGFLNGPRVQTTNQRLT